MTRVVELSYQADNSALFDRIRELPWAIWLDSQGRDGRELLCALPRCSATWQAGLAAWQGEPPEHLGKLGPFAAAQALRQQFGNTGTDLDTTFQGGIIGFWAYEAGVANADITMPGQGPDYPDAALGWYDWFIEVDHGQSRTRLVFLSDCPAPTRLQVEQALSCSRAAAPETFRLLTPFQHHSSRTRYAADIRRILDYIQAGDCYQVNYTQAFSAPCAGSPWVAYQALRRHSRSPFAAYLHYPFGDVLCLSPEQFIEVSGNDVRSRPIKGTRPRFRGDAARDQASAAALLASAKERAENVMITDLLRNDIGRHARIGSVQVPVLCELQSFSLVHHLVSTISAQLAPGSSAMELLQDAFPGGSITGAPKRRAMEIIAELEPSRRSVYCGSIGYLSANGDLQTNIAIRTLLCTGGRVWAWAGGGITADSVWEEEYQECFNKIGGLLKTLEEMR